MDFPAWLFHNALKPLFWFQPVFYSFHGWLATEMALWLLFHPYEPKYIPGTQLQIPFTPGIFPRGRHKLSVSIADTITDILLTQEDIKKQAEKLITEANIYAALDMLFDSVGNELKDITNIRRIYRYVDDLLPPLIQKLSMEYITSLENQKNKQFNLMLGQLFNRILPHLSINADHADFIAKTLFDVAITPANVRKILVGFLTDANIEVLESTLLQRIGGIQGILIRFVDLKKGFVQFRTFLVEDAAEAEVMLGHMLSQMNMQEKLKQQILQFSPQSLPVETLEETKKYLIQALRNVLIQNRDVIVETISHMTSEATHAISNSLMQVDYNQVSEAWLPGFKKDLARFVYTYLNKELENMLSKALPAISLNTVIVDKIDQFSAKELEETIQGICHRELRWLAFLGGFLGFWLGLVSNFVAYWWHPIS